MQKRLLSVGKRGPRSFIGGTQVDLVVWQSRHLTSCRTEFLKELLNMLFVACFQKGGLAGLYSHAWRFIVAQIIHMKRSSPLICQLGIREYSCRDKDIGVRCLDHGMKWVYDKHRSFLSISLNIERFALVATLNVFHLMFILSVDVSHYCIVLFFSKILFWILIGPFFCVPED